MSGSEKSSSPFTGTDRRGSDASGEQKLGNPGHRPEGEPPRTLPPADFTTLVLSLGSSAAMFMGEAEPGGKPTRNLPMAKHSIDLLDVLLEKTKGNLNAEESQILESLLFDLRLRYVEALKSAG
jgi:hypothetical protein